jgi:hypothetical protein
VIRRCCGHGACYVSKCPSDDVSADQSCGKQSSRYGPPSGGRGAYSRTRTCDKELKAQAARGEGKAATWLSRIHASSALRERMLSAAACPLCLSGSRVDGDTSKRAFQAERDENARYLAYTWRRNIMRNGRQIDEYE